MECQILHGMRCVSRSYGCRLLIRIVTHSPIKRFNSGVWWSNVLSVGSNSTRCCTKNVLRSRINSKKITWCIPHESLLKEMLESRFSLLKENCKYLIEKYLRFKINFSVVVDAHRACQNILLEFIKCLLTSSSPITCLSPVKKLRREYTWHLANLMRNSGIAIMR